MRKTFTMGEVQTLLPLLESLMQRAQNAGVRAGEIGASIEELRQTIFIAGGMRIDVAAVARQRAAQGTAVEEAKTIVAEMEQIGAHVHDLGEGLLDLPFRTETGEVMLCWKMGEPAVTHWHGTEDDPEDRLPLNQLFERGEHERLN